MAIATSTLATIQTKVRRLTRSLSLQLLSQNDLDQYINTFIAYDMPEHLRQFNLRKQFSFYTIPGVDRYDSSTNPASPLYKFTQNYLTVHPPILVSGFQAGFTEDRNQLFSQYPINYSIASIGTTGDGISTQFSGVVNTQQVPVAANPTQMLSLLQNNVIFNSEDVNGNALAMIDSSLADAGLPQIGNLYVPGGIPTSTVAQDLNNYINYNTGQYVVTFTGAPAVGATINSQTVPTQLSMPLILLFYGGTFFVRPVPDQVYRINMEVYVRPTQLLQTSDSPQLEEWWQYIAYGAAKKIFEDRMDLESVAMIMPEFDKQQRLCLRRTIVQQTSQRVSTIYAESNGNGSGTYGMGGGNSGSQF